jgi:hypothetical protein
MPQNSPHQTLAAVAAQSLRWRDILELLAALRRLPDPFASADGLRQAIALLVRLAEIVGIDDAWTERLRQIVTDPALLKLVLAIIDYLAYLVADKPRGPATALAEVDHIDAQGLAEWLPIVLEIIRLIKQLRGGQ